MWECRSPRMSCELDQPGQLPAGGRRQLAAVLAQLGLDVVESEQPIQLLLRGAGDRFLLPVGEDAVLGHVQSAAHRGFAQRRVVGPGAREVLEQVAELRGLGDPQVDGDARVGARLARRACRRRRRARSLRSRARLFASVVGLRRDGDQVDVLHAVGHPPRRARDLHVRARTAPLEQARGERLAQLERARQEQPSARPLGRFGGHPVERREHAFLELRAESLHGPQPLRQRRLAQLLGRVDPELGEQQPRALGPQARQSRDRDQARRELRAHPLRRGRRAGVEQRDDLLLERRADPRQLGRAAGAGQRGDRDGRLAHRLRRVAVGEHAVDDRPVELVQVAELLARRRSRRRRGPLRQGMRRV